MRKGRVALEHNTAIRIRLGTDGLAVDQDLSAGRLLHADEHLQERRLAAPGGANDGHELVFGDLQSQVFQHYLRAVFLPDIADRDSGHQRSGSAQRKARARSIRSARSDSTASSVIHTTYGRITSIAR